MVNMKDKEKIEEEIIEELTTKYDCDGISAITAEKCSEGEWLLEFHTWDGHVFKMIARNIELSKQ
ncbi:MAG: hypothetical protein DRQ24_08555 [Candidatus Latescibacterota bacterium]|nr:MAG: hypothetical protein DRQ24_08555 [Candidatus Latescibacterota bacterium]